MTSTPTYRAAKEAVSTDPRGPVRTIAAVEPRTDITLIQFDECDHTGRFVPHFTYTVGDTIRCFQCGPAARAADKADV